MPSDSIVARGEASPATLPAARSWPATYSIASVQLTAAHEPSRLTIGLVTRFGLGSAGSNRPLTHSSPPFGASKMPSMRSSWFER